MSPTGSAFGSGLFLAGLSVVLGAPASAEAQATAPSGLRPSSLPRPLEEVAAQANLPPLHAAARAAEALFEENRGQFPAYISFVWNADTLILTDGSSVVLSDISATSQPGKLQATFLRTEFRGSSPSRPIGREPAPGVFNYLRGQGPSRSAAGVSRFQEVRFGELYAGIDLVYRQRDGSLKYDFIVRPGADPSSIRMRFVGSKGVRIDQQGRLVIQTNGRQVVHQKPEVFEQTANGPRPVSTDYRAFDDGSVGFAVVGRDPDLELVIDPEIVYSTYLGGSRTLRDEVCTLEGNENDIGNSIAVDAQNRALIAGRTCSVDFPTENPFQGDLASITFESQTDAFVARLSPDGSALELSTYLGGSDFDEANAVAVGPGNALTVAGITQSEDFPLQEELFAELSAGVSASDAFVTVLTFDGQSLEFSTYLGGTGDERAEGVAVGGDGVIAVVGETDSEDFPLAEAFQSVHSEDDAFVTLIAPDRQSLVFSTYLGSAQDDLAEDVAIDLSHNVIVVGTTLTTPFGADVFPTVDPLKEVNDSFLSDAFVAKFSADGKPVFISLLGGPQTDEGRAVAVNSQGEIFAAGGTGGEFFPEPSDSALQTNHGGAEDAFVVKLDALGQEILYSTYFGGPDSEIVAGIALDGLGAAVLAGEVTGSGLPLERPIQETFGGGRDVFVAKLTTNGEGLIYSTFLGGATDDVGRDIAVDGEGDAYVTGFTFSDNYPVAKAYQVSLNGTVDALITKIGESLVDFRYEYASKVVCGKQPQPEILSLARGAYATTVNVHSPGRERATFRKKLALSIPPGFQHRGPIVPLSFDTLDYDEALASDCEDLRERIRGFEPEDENGILAADFFEGFLVVQSTHPLDVTAVYSTATLGQEELPSENASIDVEEVSERDRIRPADLLITKESYRWPSIFFADKFEYFFVGYIITVSNLGAVDAYNLVIKDFLTWDAAVAVLPLESTFVVGSGGSLEVDAILPILLSQGTIEMTGQVPVLEAGGTTLVSFWTIGVRILPEQVPTTLVDSVFLSSAGEDPNPGNNSAIEVTDF